MTDITITDASLSSVRGKNVVLTGGAAGIGAATVTLLHSLDCTVTFGDIQVAAGTSIAASLGPRAAFVNCDITSYASQLALFKRALDFGRIDIVFANAGITSSAPFLPTTPPTSDPTEPALPDIDTNLRGAMFTAHLALHYLRPHGGALVFTGSAASYCDTPPIFMYTASKHGVLGAMRAMRAPAEDAWNMRVNLVAPWLTKTAMAATLGSKWGDRPINSPEGVARALAYAASEDGGNGKGYWVGGDKVIEMEDAIRGRRDIWLGEEMAAALNDGQRALGGW